MQNLTYFDEALKIDYLPVIREQLNHSTILLDKLQRNERDVQGKQWQLVAHYMRNSGVGGGSETGLPTAGYQNYKNPYGNVRYNRGRISVSGKTLNELGHFSQRWGLKHFSEFGGHPVLCFRGQENTERNARWRACND